MNKFIAGVSIRDFNLSKEIMADLPTIIAAENSTRGFDVGHYVFIEDGLVTKCVMLVTEGEVSSAVYFHQTTLEEIEALVREVRPNVTTVNAFCRNQIDKTNGWEIIASNYVAVSAKPVKDFEMEDTENNVLKIVTGNAGRILCTVIPGVMSVTMSSEPTTSDYVNQVEMAAGVAHEIGSVFGVCALTTQWQVAMLTNPNFRFNNTTASKKLVG